MRRLAESSRKPASSNVVRIAEQQQRGEGPGTWRVAACTRAPSAHTTAVGGGDLALAEAERRPDDERHEDEGAARGRRAEHAARVASDQQHGERSASSDPARASSSRCPGRPVRTSGATSRMPEASPCHQVSQFQSSSPAGIACSAASGSRAKVGAIVASRARRAPTNLSTCVGASRSGRARRSCRRTSAAAATACSALPVAMSAETGAEACDRQVGGEAADPDPRPGARAEHQQRRRARFPPPARWRRHSPAGWRGAAPASPPPSRPPRAGRPAPRRGSERGGLGMTTYPTQAPLQVCLQVRHSLQPDGEPHQPFGNAGRRPRLGRDAPVRGAGRVRNGAFSRRRGWP